MAARKKLTEAHRQAVIAAMTRRAAAGSPAAAKIVLDEYKAEHPQGEKADFSLLDEVFRSMTEGADDGRPV